MAKNEKAKVVVAEEVETPSRAALPKRKVKVVPVKKKGWLPQDHEASFLYQHATNAYTVPRKQFGGSFVDPLTKEEREIIESMPGMSLSPGDLSVNKRDNNFWANMQSIRLGKDEFTLDLENPMDYIKYKVLLANSDHIAPDADSVRGKASYKYVIVDLGYEDTKKSSEADLYADAYGEFLKVRGDRNSLADLSFLLTNKRVSANTTLDWLKGQVGEFVKKNPARFLSVIKDEDLQLKVLLEKAVTYDAVQKDGTVYCTMNGDLMGVDKTAAIAFLKNKANGDHRAVIEEMVRRAE